MNETEKQIETLRAFAHQVKRIGEDLRQCPSWRQDGDVVIKAGEIIDRLVSCVTKEKRDIPPTPPIESKEKAPPPPARTRASEFDDKFLEKWGIPKLFAAYWQEVTWGDGIKNPKRSIRNYWSHASTDKAWFAFKAAHEKLAEKLKKTYPPEAWELCRECRCAHATANGCWLGVHVPPDHEDQPHPHRPEKCAGFRKI